MSSVLFLVALLVGCAVGLPLDRPKRSPIYDNHFFARQFFQYFNESDVSIECKTVANYVKNHENEDWALRLMDASGVVASGVAKGNYQFMGDFDECLDIDVKLDSRHLISGFAGQYCTLQLPIDAVMGESNSSDMDVIKVLHLSPSIGVCLPTACTQDDLKEILKTFTSRTNQSITISDCTTHQSNPIQWIHVLIISGFCTIIILILIGTIIDTTHISTKSKSHHKLFATFESFSICKNSAALFTVTESKDTIGCFHGFRVVSLLFIIIYHVYTEGQVPSANLLEILASEKNFLLQVVTNAALWVEAFFLLSGFLCANGVIRQLSRTSVKEYTPVSNIVHRYLRLTPSLLGVMAFAVLQEVMASGPQWHQYVKDTADSCHKNWWTNLLYVNNIVNLNQLGVNNECLSFTWYLAVDMQLFLVSPILIILLACKDTWKQHLGVALNVLVIVASCALTAVIIVANGLTPTVLMTVYDLPYINKVYKQAYCRVGPYCVGILMAYYYNKHKDQLKISRPLNLALWLLSLALNLSITFLTFPWLNGQSYHTWPSVLYGAVHRPLWALSWAYILVACATSHGSFVNRLLSWQPLVPFSRLSFQAYLYHSVLIARFVNSARQPVYASNINLIMQFIQYTVLTFLVSYLACLMFELPFANLEKLFTKKSKKQDPMLLRQQVSHQGSHQSTLSTN